MKKYLLGYDVGSSSVKASLIDAATGQVVASAQSPSEEMSMLALRPGWAEQDPDVVVGTCGKEFSSLLKKVRHQRCGHRGHWYFVSDAWTCLCR